MIFISDPGTNFFGEMKQLMELALMSKRAGATTFKPQIYDAAILYNSNNNPYYDLQKKCSLSFEQVQEIYNYCEEIGIQCIFSVFDTKYFSWLEKIGCNTLKIAASLAGNNEFISEASNYGFDVIVSFSKEHPHLSVWKYKDMFKNVQFMSCVSKYPAQITDYNLKEIEVLEGVSDHTNDMYLSIAATAVGVNTIEKHVWFRYHDTPDIHSSIHIFEFEKMINICNDISSIR